MKKLIPLLLLFGVASVAMAATLSISWQNATEYTDGTPIATTGSERIASTQVEYGPCNAARNAITQATTVSVPYPETSPGVIDGLEPGVWCARARHITAGGTAGLWTSVGSVVKEPRIPKAPTNFSFGSGN